MAPKKSKKAGKRRRPRPRPDFINTLPEEILLEIFMCARELWEKPWSQVIWVCRRWSNLVRSTPMLWQEIDVFKKPNVNLVQMALEFSQTHPVDVSFYETVDFETSLTILSPHIPRIRSLHVDRIKNTNDRTLTKLLSHTMPALESLQLSFVPLVPHFDYTTFSRHNEEDTVLFSWAPRIDQFPNMSRFSLGRAVAIMGPMPVFPKLTRLELHDFLPAPFDIILFTQFLSCHPKLEEVFLRKYRPTILPVTEPLSLPVTVRKLSIEDNAHYVKPFLSSFHFPPHVHVSLTRALDYMDHGDFDTEGGHFADDDDDLDEYDEDGEYGSDRDDEYASDEDDSGDGSGTDYDSDGENLKLLKTDITAATSRGLTVTKMLPDDRSVLPILGLVTSVELRREMETQYTLTGRTPSGAVVEVSGKMYEDAETDIREKLHVLDDLVTVFFGAPVTELRVDGHGSSKIEKYHWVRALRAFPNLERLSLEETSALTPWDARPTLFDALCMRSPDSGAVMWQQLKSLTVLSDIWDKEDEQFSAEIAECLQRRAAGGSRLQELCIILKYFDIDVGGAKALENEQRSDIYIQTLQPSVDTLRFEYINKM